MTTPGYSRTQIALHWIVAALISAQYLFKDAISEAWTAYVQGQSFAFDPLILAHVTGGIIILALVLWRIVLRFSRGAPPLPEKEHPALKLAAKAVHVVFYLVLIGLSVSGGLAWFADVRVAANLHNVLKVVLLALIVVHVGAVVFHQLILKTAIMQRMLRPSV
ncbi:cytochrome b/b6 domain-containing protein [uncultured Roseibium sp.]|uniref:cytochrome b n=1 Tax=uncultured Roseibium sp. TaxID=1936171 RepID=UPI0032172840